MIKRGRFPLTQRTEMHDGDITGTLIAHASDQANGAFIVERVNPA